jgi:hypothetical protein
MILIFASIFRSENALTYDSQQLRHYAQVGRDFIRADEPLSSIARRGAKLLDALISFDVTATDSLDIELDIRDMILLPQQAASKVFYLGFMNYGLDSSGKQI